MNAEQQYDELVNNVLPRLGEKAMKMFIDSDFSIPKLFENLFYALNQEEQKSQAHIGDKNVECILRIGRILTRKVVISKDYLRHFRVAIHPPLNVLSMSDDQALAVSVKTLAFEWRGSRNALGMPILDIIL